MKVLLTTLTLVVLFVAGAAGTYFVMPIVAPERVVEARRYLDSLDQALRVDSASLAVAPLPDSTEADSAAALPDTLGAAEPPENAPSDPTLGGAVAGPTPAPAAGPVLAEAPPADEARQAAEEARRTQARELSAVVSKLEDAELRALVSQLDADVLTLLYREASARNKTRLLQAIPPGKAAEFVRTLITPVAEK